MQDLRAYFARTLIRVTNDLRTQASSAILVEDIGQVESAGAGLHRQSSRAPVGLRLQIEGLLTRLERDRELVNSIPGRSHDPGRYRSAIAERW